MPGQSQVRSLRRVNKSSNLSIHTTIMSPETEAQATDFAEPASTLPQKSTISSSSFSTTTAYQAALPNPVSMDMRWREPDSYFHTTKNFPPKRHGYKAAIESALKTPTAALHTVGRLASSAINTRCPSLGRTSRLRGLSAGSFMLSRRHRPSISEPSHPRLVTSSAGAQNTEQPLVRYATLTREGNEFQRRSTTSPNQPRSQHNVDTPDPLRCHTAQPNDPNDQVPSSTQSSAPYNLTDQHLTSSQRWQRRFDQEHLLVMNLQTQLADVQREVEAQRNRADHFQRAEALVQKQSVQPYLAMESLEHREQIDNLVKNTAHLEQQLIDANAAKIKAEAIANTETKVVNSLRYILDYRNAEIETLQDQLDESQAKLEQYQRRCEELEAAQLLQNVAPANPEPEPVDEPEPIIENPNVPARTFSVLMERMGRTQPEVNSTSNIDLLLPIPSIPIQAPNESLQVAEEAELKNKQRSSTLRSFWLPQRSSLLVEDAESVEEEVEKKDKRGSGLRPLLLPQRLSLPIRQQEVPVPTPASEVEVGSTEPFPSYEEPFPEESPILEPFPAYVEPYPEAPYPRFQSPNLTLRKHSNGSYQERVRRNGTEAWPEYVEPSLSTENREQTPFPAYEEYSSTLQNEREEGRPASVKVSGERFASGDEDEDGLEGLREYGDYLMMGFESGRRVSH